jgi:hypothetical protein
VLGRKLVVGADERALQQAPHALNGVSGDARGRDPFVIVVDRLVAGVLVLNPEDTIPPEGLSYYELR